MKSQRPLIPLMEINPSFKVVAGAHFLGSNSGQEGHPRSSFETGEDIVVSVSFRTTEPVHNPIFGIALFRDDNLYIPWSKYKTRSGFRRNLPRILLFYSLEENPPLVGNYVLSIAVFDEHHIRPHIWHNQLYSFSIHSTIEDHGILLLHHEWGMITHLEETSELIPLHPETEEDDS